MRLLNRREQSEVSELRTMLGTLHLDEPPIMGRVIALLQSVVGWGYSWGYGPHRGGSGEAAVSWAYAWGLDSARAEEELNGVLRTGILAYDPLRPGPWQRNRILRIDQILKESPRPAAGRQALRLGFTGAFGRVIDQPRALLCDGPLFLGWFGLVLPDRAGARHRQRVGRERAQPLAARAALAASAVAGHSSDGNPRQVLRKTGSDSRARLAARRSAERWATPTASYAEEIPDARS